MRSRLPPLLAALLLASPASAQSFKLTDHAPVQINGTNNGQWWLGPSSTVLAPGAAAANLGFTPPRVFNPRDYANGATICTGFSDDTAVLTATINAVAGAGVVHIPNGCGVNGTLNISAGSVYVEGEGRSATLLRQISTTADTFLFSGSAFDGGVRNLRIYNVNTATAGCAINVTNGVGDVQVASLRIERAYNGLCMNNAPVTGGLTGNNIQLANIVNDDALINGASQFFLANSVGTNAGGAGIHLLSSGGTYLQNVTMGGATEGLFVNPTTGNSVLDTFADNFEADTSNGTGISFDSTGGGLIFIAHLSNIRSGYGLGAGFAFNGPNTGNIDLTNWSAERNLHEGMNIFGIQNSHIGYGQSIGNSVATATYAGVNITGASHTTIDHLRSTYAYPNQANSNQTYGVLIQGAFAGDITISDSDVAGNVTAGLYNGNTAGTVVLRNIAGFNPVGVQYPALPASNGTFTNGATPATVLLNGGTCSAIKIGGVAIGSAQCSSATLPLAPNQTMILTYSVAPAFTLVVQ